MLRLVLRRTSSRVSLVTAWLRELASILFPIRIIATIYFLSFFNGFELFFYFNYYFLIIIKACLVKEKKTFIYDTVENFT